MIDWFMATLLLAKPLFYINLLTTVSSITNYSVIASSRGEMIDLPALSYGLFHGEVKPIRMFNSITTGINFQGLNMDIGHLRGITWVKNDDPASAINNTPSLMQNGKSASRNRWINYNRSKGQYESGAEHAGTEQFWVNKKECRYVDDNNQIVNPLLPDCAQAISAMKAIAIAQSQGQKIYTINRSNAATALSKLPVTGVVGDEIRNAIQQGMEVTIHEKPVTAYGWTGYGYIITDPETGGGAYLVAGGGNGAFLFITGVFIIGMIIAMLPAILATGTLLAVAPLLVLGIGSLIMGASLLGIVDKSFCKLGFSIIIGTTFAVLAGIILSWLTPLLGTAAAVSHQIVSFLLSSSVARVSGALYGWATSDGVCPG